MQRPDENRARAVELKDDPLVQLFHRRMETYGVQVQRDKWGSTPETERMGKQLCLSFTPNGYQWQTLQMYPWEVLELVDELVKQIAQDDDGLTVESYLEHWLEHITKLKKALKKHAPVVAAEEGER